MTSLGSPNLPSKVYRAPFYSDEDDVPGRPKEFAGLVYHLKGGKGISLLEEFAPASTIFASQYSRDELSFQIHPGWEYAELPPSRKAIRHWLQYQRRVEKQRASQKVAHSQV